MTTTVASREVEAYGWCGQESVAYYDCDMSCREILTTEPTVGWSYFDRFSRYAQQWDCF